MSIKTPIQTIVNEGADPALAVYATSPQVLRNVEGANIYITQTTERITQVVNNLTQVYPVAANIAGGTDNQIQYNKFSRLAAEGDFTYDDVTNTLYVAGNVTTTTIRTDNLLRVNGLPWDFVTYTNVNVSSYLSTFTGDISANVVTANVFSGSGASLTNIANTSIVGSVALADEANLANIANIAHKVDAGNVVGKVNSATLADDSVRIDGGNVVGNVGFATVAYSIDAANVTGVIAEANLANIANIAYSVDAGNVLGKVASASSADTATNVTNALQANIEVVGNLRFLDVVAPDVMTGFTGNGNISANNISLLANVSANYVLANVFWANVKDTPTTLTAYGISSSDSLLYSNNNVQSFIATNTANVKGDIITANSFVGEGGNISNIAWASIVGAPTGLSGAENYVTKTEFNNAIAQIYSLLTDGGNATGITTIDGGTSSSTYTTTIDGGTA